VGTKADKVQHVLLTSAKKISKTKDIALLQKCMAAPLSFVGQIGWPGGL